MITNLTGKVALVTGAGSALGQIIADKLAANGARVVYADADLAAAGKNAAQVPQAMALLMSTADEAQVTAGFEVVREKFGRLDILVNSAVVNAAAEHRVTFDRYSPEEWDRIIRINLHGVFLVSRAAARLMIPQKAGSIISIASVLGLVPARLQCAYTTSKAGVVNLTRAMALELGPHDIVVNAVAPGSMTVTAGDDKNHPLGSQTARLLSHVPLGRLGTFDDIARTVLFFAAPESRYVTGQILCVDGGWSAGGFFRDF